VSAFPFLDGLVASAGAVEEGGEKRLLVGTVCRGFDGFEVRFEVAAGLVTAVAVAGFAEVFELLVRAVPPVAVLVVLAGLRTGDGVTAGDAGDFPPPTPTRGTPHGRAFGRRVLSTFRHLVRWVFEGALARPRRAAKWSDAAFATRSGRFIPTGGRRTGMEVKSRHHLRADAVAAIEDALAEHLGVEMDADSYEKVEFDDSGWNVVLVDGEPLVLYVDAADGGDPEPFLTVQGANAYPPERNVVTVDAGAVSFVSDGADVMRPGIVEADDAIEAGDLVAINEESHGKFLAIGRAQVAGSDMVGDSGKVVTSIHHVGDDLFEFTV